MEDADFSDDSCRFLPDNQAIAAVMEAGDERTPYVYSLRVLGFLLILYAIIDKNMRFRRPPRS